MSMFAEERYMRIIEIVNHKGKVTVAELGEQLGVSQVTVRRDLEKLEELELLKRTHGGALSVQQANVIDLVAVEKSFSEKEVEWAEEKDRIASAAEHLVNENESVLLTPGTTNMILAKKLTSKKELTLVTNSVNIAAAVGPQSGIEVILLGGIMRKKSFALVGPIAEDALGHIRVDKLFLGVDGFDIEQGLSTPNLAEASINRKMISIAQEVIVVADHSKFGRIMFSHIAPIDVVHTVITDREPSDSDRKRLEECGIKLVIA